MTDRSTSIARVQFLGTQRITIGAEVISPDSERLFAMIVRLCVPLGRLTSRQTMLDLLWPGAEDAPARHNLRQTVYKARELGLVVESDEDGLRLDPRHWSCDWEDAVGDVPGEWLYDYEPDFSDELRSWIGSQRIGVHASLRPRLIRTLQAARSSGDLLLADRHAVQLLRVDELNEEATLTRAEVMALQGAKIDALKLLDAYLHEMGRLGSGKDAALPAQLLRRRIAEKLPALTYNCGSQHYGPLVGRAEDAKRLLAGLFDARGGRGTATLVHGAEGIGKSRLLLEVQRAAILQGMQILEFSCTSAAHPAPLSTLRELVRRLLEVRGAYGISPDALDSIRAWLISNETAPDDCPLMEIEDLLASVSEETPLLLLMEHAERMDAESLGRLDRVYRRGVSRYHQLILTSSTYATPSGAAVTLREIERLSLRPLSLVEVREVVTAFAAEANPRATSDQIACAAVFAEGNPMYGVEMLGLILDPGSPDVIPWRVKVAVERVVAALSDEELRTLASCRLLSSAARSSILNELYRPADFTLSSVLDALEASGLVRCDDSVFVSSPLVSDAAILRVSANAMRADSLRAAEVLANSLESLTDPGDFYACIRQFISAQSESRATPVFNRYVGMLVRKDSATNIVHELSKLRRLARTHELTILVEETIAQILSGAESRRFKRVPIPRDARAASLPHISAASVEVEHTLASNNCLAQTLGESRDPSSPPAARLAEAVMALFVASNLSDSGALESAYEAVQAVRHARDANQFDVHRADVIYFASIGERHRALESAESLVVQSRLVSDVQLSCKGFRNAAQVFQIYGRPDMAQSLLHESRSLASRLGYSTQQVWADIRLADLCTMSLDVASASSYLDAAEATIAKHDLRVPLLNFDLGFHRCWTLVVAGDIYGAQKCAKFVCRHVSRKESGTALWTRLAVKLATYRGTENREVNREFLTLKQSIGSRPFYGDEQYVLAALLLFAKRRADFRETSDFVSAQFVRIEAMGQKIWPFLTRNLDKSEPCAL